MSSWSWRQAADRLPAGDRLGLVLRRQVLVQAGIVQGERGVADEQLEDPLAPLDPAARCATGRSR